MPKIDQALKLLRSAPRVEFGNIKKLPWQKVKIYGGFNRLKRGLGHRGLSQYQNWSPIGSLYNKLPPYLKMPVEAYYQGKWFDRQLQRISLHDLQRLIDMNRVDPNEPIDLTSICNTKLFRLDTRLEKHFGFQLTEEGIDLFTARVNVEVQYASEPVIAAVERNGGRITCRYYDLFSVYVKQNPAAFFQYGLPIPKSKMPPPNALEYYSNVKNRGYLCDTREIEQRRIELSQKYGYELAENSVESSSSAVDELMRKQKDPRQIFYDLSPGSLVNLIDQTVLVPTDPDLADYYKS